MVGEGRLFLRSHHPASGRSADSHIEGTVQVNEPLGTVETVCTILQNKRPGLSGPLWTYWIYRLSSGSTAEPCARPRSSWRFRPKLLPEEEVPVP